MDSHNVGRNRDGIENALSLITAKTLVIGIKSDLLFPIEEQHYLYKQIPGAALTEIDSYYGHDGFLVETGLLTRSISLFYKANAQGKIINLQQTAQ